MVCRSPQSPSAREVSSSTCRRSQDVGRQSGGEKTYLRELLSLEATLFIFEVQGIEPFEHRVIETEHDVRASSYGLGQIT